MVEPIPLGTIEGHLCGHLSAALSGLIADTQQGGVKGCRVRSTDMGHWSQAERALDAIGVMQQEVTGGGHGPHLVFSMNSEEMPRYLASAVAKDDPRIDILLTAFVGITCHGYGIPSLTDERDWFSPSHHFDVAMEWLANAGYAENDGDLYRWTDNIAPAMQANHYWTQDNVSEAMLAQSESDTLLDQIWASMPETIKHSIKTGRIDQLEILKIITSGMDGRWVLPRKNDHLTLKGGLAPLVVKIIERARHKE